MIKLTKIIIILLILTSCTLSFTNICTHGIASDLVEEQQDAEADIEPDIKLPLISP